MLNNEPFDLAHSALAPSSAGYNERSGLASDRAIIMIAPFPSAAPAKYTPPGGLLSYCGAILTTLLEQVRFNPEVLVLAADDNVYSRFLVSPKRPEDFKGGNIACGALEGFGGFLHEGFRHHDFMLGRYNCQKFLKKYFTLPCGGAEGNSAGGNPLFANWDAASLREHRVTFTGYEGWELPIIPCLGTAKPPLSLPDWPTYPSLKLDKLLVQIGDRYMRLGKLLVDEHTKGFVTPNLLKFALWSQKNKALAWIRKTIIADLTTGHDIHVTRAGTTYLRPKDIAVLVAIGLAAAIAVLAVIVLKP